MRSGVIEHKRGRENLYAYRPDQPLDRDPIARAVEEQLAAKGSPYGADDDEPAWSLFRDRGAIEREMTHVVRRRVLTKHGEITDPRGFVAADTMVASEPRRSGSGVPEVAHPPGGSAPGEGRGVDPPAVGGGRDQ